MNLKFEFLMHWLFAAVFGILLLTGLALMGPQYGWVLNYNLALADYLHRTLAVIFTLILFIEILLEIKRIVTSKGKREPWLVIGKKGFGLITLVTSWLLILSGLFLLHCMDQNHTLLALASNIHEMATFAMVIGMVWHVYDKSHVLTIGGARK